ncbi:hypothetical protein KC19_2G086100 [Ceratodon purpureus]|uniref:DNA-directed DNA polymerase n=1 Tax=Ceratodon purpureus TaxID=3225 RepID=A0A8T0IUM2_CERPU|nr:hypothetical protein KC19_2G086100 [Ceratodon purpureus]
MASVPGTAAGAGLVSTPQLLRPCVPGSRRAFCSRYSSDGGVFGSSRSSFLASRSFRDGRSDDKTGRSKEVGIHSRRICTSNAKECVAMGSSQGAFFYRTFIARPSIRLVNTRRGGCYRYSDDSHYVKQFSRRKSSMVGRVSNNFSHSNYLNPSGTESKHSDWGIAELELEDSLLRAGRSSWDAPAARSGRVSATAFNPVLSPAPYAKEQVQPHPLSNAFNTALQLGSSGISAVALRSTPNTWVAPSRTVKVAYQAVSRIQSSSVSVLPQFSKRVGKIGAQNQSSPLLVSSQVPDVSGREPHVRALIKLGIPLPTKSLSAAAYKTQASLSGIEPSSLAVDSRAQPEPFRLVASPVSKPEVFKVASPRRNASPELRKVSDPVSERTSEPANSSEKISEENQLKSNDDKPEIIKTKKAPARKRTTTKKAAADGLVGESKPKPRARKKSVSAQPEEKILPEANSLNDPSVSSLASVESSNEDLLEERQSFPNESVMIVNSVEMATKIVEQLMGEYKDLVHACDTEVAEIDVKNESPVGHGRITCFSIYCGPGADFGDGKNRLWVDVLDGGEGILQVFKSYFEDPCIKKVWHNYSFDKHILSRHGIHAQGFYADTMHLARLYDSARRGAKGGYSLEVLSADEKVMDSYVKHLNEMDDPILAGKKSMKELFGKANLKKDGTPGKIKTIPPVDELQRGEQWRDAWIHYSTFDAVCTWRLWQSLQQKLKSTSWNVPDLRQKGTMYDFYEKYWRPFGEVLVNMEADGMLVDCDHLASVEKVARQQQQISISRFRKWAAKYCPDAALMNVGSDAQIRQFLFGGTANRKDSSVLPMERVFNVPNDDGFIEEGKKVAKKTKPIVIKGLANWNIRIPVETYTTSGWPAVGGAAIKALAGKVAVDYTNVEGDSEDGLLEDLSESGGLLTSAGVLDDHEEDLSVYGKAYEAFRKAKSSKEECKEACMALAALCEVASINTLLSNFIEPLQGNDIKSTSDGRVHCSLNINTETGRLSARRPSLQNQPALEKDRYKIRQAFVAAPGKSLVVADYGQLELRLLAHLADCKSMKEAFKAGGDFHSRTAMNMYPHVREAVEKERVLLEWEGQGKPPAPLLKDIFGSERRKAKMLNFSIAYGKTAMGLAKDWKVKLDEAKATVDLWYSDRPEVLAWQKERKREAHETLKVHTLLGRARHLPDVNSPNSLLRSHMERAAINTPVQGSAADVAMCAMLEINRNEKLRELGWKLLLQVHDEVILEGPSESAAEAKDLVIHSMMYPFDGENFLDVELVVDGDHALNWYAAK